MRCSTGCAPAGRVPRDWRDTVIDGAPAAATVRLEADAMLWRSLLLFPFFPIGTLLETGTRASFPPTKKPLRGLMTRKTLIFNTISRARPPDLVLFI